MEKIQGRLAGVRRGPGSRELAGSLMSSKNRYFSAGCLQLCSVCSVIGAQMHGLVEVRRAGACFQAPPWVSLDPLPAAAQGATASRHCSSRSLSPQGGRRRLQCLGPALG